MLLEDLTPELLALVMGALGSPTDLHNLVSVSARCYRVYRRSLRYVLSNLLVGSVSSSILRHLIAVLHVPTQLSAVALQPGSDEELAPILAQYLEGASHPKLPMAESDLVALCHIHSRLSFFTDRYIRDTMSYLYDAEPQGSNGFPATQMNTTGPAGEKTEGLMCWPPSWTERERVQRAFLRFELYCRAFLNQPRERSSFFVAQSGHFVFRLNDWEVEEMNCIYGYYSTIVGESIHRLEVKIVQSVLAAPGVRRLDSRNASTAHDHKYESKMETNFKKNKGANNTRDHESTTEVDEIGETWSNFQFDDLGKTSLALFASARRPELVNWISQIATSGIGFMHRLIETDETKVFKLVRASIAVPDSASAEPRRGALLRLLWRHYAGQYRTHETAQTPVSYNDPSQPNLAYVQFVSAAGNLLRSHLRKEDQLNSLRHVGYVFWDAERIQETGVYERLSQASGSASEKNVGLMDWFFCPGIEERLKGVWLPADEMRKIEETYGSGFGQGFVDGLPASQAAVEA